MTSFEQAFEAVEEHAKEIVKRTGALASLAKKLHNAAKDGNIPQIRKLSEQLNGSLGSAGEVISNSISPWPFSSEEEEEYIKTNYVAELLNAAEGNDLKIIQDADRLIVFPSVLRVLPSDKAVMIDRVKIPILRPSKLVTLLKSHQTKKPKFASERFVESVHKAYVMLAGKEGYGIVIALHKIYDALTLAPGAAQEYGKSDFARDLYLLDRSGLNQTKSGATLTFPASTGTKGPKARDTYVFVSPEGETMIYYGIKFTEKMK